jgi:hypothetical protein
MSKDVDADAHIHQPVSSASDVNFIDLSMHSDESESSVSSLADTFQSSPAESTSENMGLASTGGHGISCRTERESSTDKQRTVCSVRFVLQVKCLP